MSRRHEDWRIEDHVCRVCHGRIVSREVDEDGKRLYLCTNCGLEVEGRKPSVLCACGTKIRKGKTGQLVNAGLECHRNQAQSPSFPSVIVASFAGAQPVSAC